MAQLDASIPLMVRGPQIDNPQNLLAQSLKLKSAQLGLDQQQQAVGERNALAAVLRQPGTYDASGNLQRSAIPQIAQASPSSVPGYSQVINQQDTAALQQQNAKLLAAKAHVQLQAQLLGGVSDDASWQRARQQYAATGADMTQIPQAYDPNWVAQAKQGALTAAEQFDQQYKTVVLGQNQQKIDLERDAPKGQVIDTPNGVMIVDPRSGAARPATVGAAPGATGAAAASGGITTPPPFIMGAPGAAAQPAGGPAPASTTPAPTPAGAQPGAPLMGEKAATAQAQAQKRSGAAAQAKLGLDDINSSLSRMSDVAQQLANDPDLGNISGFGGVLPNLPGGPGANVQAKLDSLKSQVGFAVLGAMRAASKTGGALGAVSDTEEKLLQNNLASLDTRQSPEQLRQQLLKIVEYANGVAQRSKAAYEQQYGSPDQPGAAQPGAPNAGGAADFSHLWGG